MPRGASIAMRVGLELTRCHLHEAHEALPRLGSEDGDRRVPGPGVRRLRRRLERRIYLDEMVPPGPTAATEAEKLKTRFLAQVDERRAPRTRATVNQLR